MTHIDGKTDGEGHLREVADDAASPPSSGAELALVRQFGNHLRLVLDAGVEVSDIVEKAIQKLKDEFSGVLDAEELDRRLSELRNCKLVSAKKFEKLSKDQQELDGNAFISYQVEGEKIHSIPILSPHSEAILLWNTILHEGTHLVAKPPHTIHDWEDNFNYVRYLGPLRFEHNGNTGKLDLSYESSDVTTMTAKSLFWEGVTDLNALRHSLPDAKNDRERQVLYEWGYVEKHYIEYLISKAAEPEKLRTAIKKSYVSGDEQAFIAELGVQFNRDGLEMYQDLLNVLKEPLSDENYERRVEKWKAIVDKG